jgi:hypothetical protein
MSSDAGVSVGAWQGGVFNVAHGSIEREFVGAFEHGPFEVDTGNAQYRELATRAIRRQLRHDDVRSS